ncbi:hypothetical protein U1Q18_032534, partial [Sarracenia purpurea var. burkii]
SERLRESSEMVGKGRREGDVGGEGGGVPLPTIRPVSGADGYHWRRAKGVARGRENFRQA